MQRAPEPSDILCVFPLQFSFRHFLRPGGIISSFRAGRRSSVDCSPQQSPSLSSASPLLSSVSLDNSLASLADRFAMGHRHGSVLQPLSTASQVALQSNRSPNLAPIFSVAPPPHILTLAVSLRSNSQCSPVSHAQALVAVQVGDTDTYNCYCSQLSSSEVRLNAIRLLLLFVSQPVCHAVFSAGDGAFPVLDLDHR